MILIIRILATVALALAVYGWIEGEHEVGIWLAIMSVILRQTAIVAMLEEWKHGRL